MTPDQIRDAAREYARRSRVEQGLPPVLEDPEAVARVAALLRSGMAQPVKPTTRKRGRAVGGAEVPRHLPTVPNGTVGHVKQVSARYARRHAGRQ